MKVKDNKGNAELRPLVVVTIMTNHASIIME